MLKKYKYLLFDLDHTLWDFDKNSSETIIQLFYEFELDLLLKTSPSTFIERYRYYNRLYWKKYENNELDKETLRWIRFHKSMVSFSYTNEELSKKISTEYLKISPYKTNLIPHAKELLESIYLNYDMIIITNGFDEIQKIKMDQTGLNKYFKHYISSESFNSKKPEPKIFKQALSILNGNRKEALMIGDSYNSDIVGAKKYGIDQVYFNPDRKKHHYQPTYDVQCISELRKILI